MKSKYELNLQMEASFGHEYYYYIYIFRKIVIYILSFKVVIFFRQTFFIEMKCL